MKLIGEQQAGVAETPQPAAIRKGVEWREIQVVALEAMPGVKGAQTPAELAPVGLADTPIKYMHMDGAPLWNLLGHAAERYQQSLGITLICCCGYNKRHWTDGIGCHNY